jgi:YjbE family integral membrane protein
MIFGLGAATALRVIFALAASKMFAYLGLRLIGGLLLLWVCWKMWRELRSGGHEAEVVEAANGAGTAPRKSFAQAAWQIVIADISMSLDNVLAVAGAARDHPTALIFGLGLSIVLMGVAANFIAGLLNKHRWIAYVGLAIILYVAGDMIWRGALEIRAEAFSG